MCLLPCAAFSLVPPNNEAKCEAANEATKAVMHFRQHLAFSFSAQVRPREEWRYRANNQHNLQFFLVATIFGAEMNFYKIMAVGATEISIPSLLLLSIRTNYYMLNCTVPCRLPRALNTSSILFLASAFLVISSSVIYSTIWGRRHLYDHTPTRYAARQGKRQRISRSSIPRDVKATS